MNTKFYIWCFARQAYWNQTKWGYTTDKSKAGQFSFADAVEICIDANKIELSEAMVPCA